VVEKSIPRNRTKNVRLILFYVDYFKSTNIILYHIRQSVSLQNAGYFWRKKIDGEGEI